MLNLDCTLVSVAGDFVAKQSYGIECRCEPDLYQRALDHFLDENGKPVCVSYTIVPCTSNDLDCTGTISEDDFYNSYTTGTITEL